METVDELLGPEKQETVDDLLGAPRNQDIIPSTGKSAYESFKEEERLGTPYSYPITVPPSMNPDWDLTRYMTSTDGKVDPLAVLKPARETLGGAISAGEAAIRQVMDVPAMLKNKLTGAQPDDFGAVGFRQYTPTFSEREAQSPDGTIIHFPRSSGTGVVAGLENTASDFATSMLGNPEKAAMMALLPTEGAAGRTVAGTFGAQAALEVPESIRNAYRFTTHPSDKSTVAEEMEAIASPVLQAYLAKQMLEHATQGGPNASRTTETQTDLPGGNTGRGGQYHNLQDAARGISEALSQGDADSLQQRLKSSGLDQEQLRRVIALLPSEEQAALEAAGKVVSGGGSLSKAASSAITVFDSQKTAGRGGDKISEAQAPVSSKVGDTGELSLTTGGFEGGIKLAEQERNLRYARQNETAAALHGHVRSLQTPSVQVPTPEGGGGVQPSAQAEETEVSLKPEHASLVEPHLEKYNGVVVDAPETGRVMRANHETGQIEINKADFEKFVDNDLKGLTPEEKAREVQNVFDHEDIHLKTDPADAEKYAGTLSGVEKSIFTRNYLKGNTGELSARNLGFEVIRKRMEQASGRTPSEFVGLTLREKWTAKSLDALAETVGKIRRVFNKDLSATQKSILDRVQANLDSARNVITMGGVAAAEGPFMQRKPDEPKEGMVRLYRGHDGAEGGAYWSTDQTYASRMGPKMEYVDIPADQLGDHAVRSVEGSGTPNAFKLPAEMTKSSQPLEGTGIPVHDLDELETPLPPTAPGERVVLVRRPDGSIYRAAYAGKKYDVSAGGKAMIEKYGGSSVDSIGTVDKNGKWTHGLLPKGDKIIKGFSPYAAVERSGEEGPAMMRKKGKAGEEPELFGAPITAKGVPGQESVPLEERSANLPETSYKQTVWPQEIDWQEGSRSEDKESLPVRPITPTEAKNPDELKKFLTEDARRGGSDLPVSFSRRVTVLFDKNDGSVHMVSTYPGDGTVRMVDPKEAGSSRPNKPIEELLDRYQPISSILMQQARQNFHQGFSSMADFMENFGNEAKQLYRERFTGLAGIPGAEGSKFVSRTRDVQPEYTGLGEATKPIEEGVPSKLPKSEREPTMARPSADELRAFHDFVGEEIPSSPEQLDRRLHRTAATAPRTAISVLRKLLKLEMQTHRGFSPGAALSNVLDQLYENLTNTETRQGFVRRTLAQLRTRIAEEVPRGGTARKTGARELTVQELLGPKKPNAGTGVEPPEGVPAVPPEMLSPEDRKILEENIEKEHNVLTPERSAQLMKSIVDSPVQKERYTVSGTKSISDLFNIENPDPDQMETIAQDLDDEQAARENPELFPERQLISEKPDVEVEQPELITKASRPNKGRTKGESGMRQALEKAESTKRQETLDLGAKSGIPVERGIPADPAKGELLSSIRKLRDQLNSPEMESASLEDRNVVKNEMLGQIMDYERRFGEFPWNSDKGPAMMRRGEKVKDAAADVVNAVLRAAHAMKATKVRGGTVDALSAARDSADNQANILADQVQKNIELDSAGKKNRNGIAQVKSAANAVLSSGAFKPVYKFEGDALDRYRELFEQDPQYQALQNTRSSQDPEMKTNAAKAGAGIHKRVVEKMREENTLPAPSDFKFQPQAREKLDGFLARAEKGIALAERMMKEGNFLARNIGRRWKRAAEDMRDEVQYAKDHWGEEDMMGTALTMRKELEGQFKREKDAGYNLRYDENYLPGRYEGDFFNDSSVVFPGLQLLGRRFAAPKSFNNYYEAISAGPYIPATRDGAAIVGSRVRSGMRQLNKMAWEEGLKLITDPETKLPIATKAKQRSDGSFAPTSPAHELVYPRPGYDPISVRKGYVSLIKNLSGYSDIQNFAPARNALAMSQKLKHAMLAFDFFHLGKMKYYDWSLNGFGNSGHRNALSVLQYRPEDLARAVDKGLVSPEEAKWSQEPVSIPLKNGKTTQMSRRDISDLMIRNGLNVGRIQDAIYKDMVAQWPVIGRYNKWLFDDLTRGVMLNSAVRAFEKYSQTHAAAGVKELARDIARDVNNEFGSIGRQGWIKNPTFQDIFRVFGLSPQWVEGLMKKETTTYSRASGLSYALGRRNLPYMGVVGSSIGRGMAAMFAITQAVNMITRGHPTWKNNEEGHKFDAWIPDTHGGDGFFISPLSIFNELTHDVVRMYYTKPTIWKAVTQIGENKLGPMGRFMAILSTGQNPKGEEITSTGGVLGAAGRELLPVPITIGKVAQLGASKVAPGLVTPPSASDVERQAASSLGVKMEPAPSAGLQMYQKAQEFLKANGLKRETGFDLTPTDEASYSKLRSAIRGGDERSALSLLKELRKTRSNDDILKAMGIWANRPFTGSNEKEMLMIQQMPEADLDVYSKAMTDREHVLDSFYTFMVKNDDGKN